MAYYTSGYQYSVPTGYQSREGVAQLQQQLNTQGAGLKVDGVWGPKTDAAYAQYTGAGGYTNPYAALAATPYGNPSGYMTTDLNSLYNQVYGILNPPSISYSMPSRTELASENAGILRPGYDHAITQRQQQTLYNRAEIDIDAASRGMGRSSYVTDVKDRAMDAEAADIARMEGEYAAALAAAVQEQYDRHLSNKLAADQYNAQMMAAAQNAAFGYATTLHSNNLNQAEALAQAALAGGDSSSSGKKSKSTKAPNGFSTDVLADMQGTAKGIYAAAGTDAELNQAIREIERSKPYDNVYAPGASDYIAGMLNGMR